MFKLRVSDLSLMSRYCFESQISIVLSPFMASSCILRLSERFPSAPFCLEYSAKVTPRSSLQRLSIVSSDTLKKDATSLSVDCMDNNRSTTFQSSCKHGAPMYFSPESSTDRCVNFFFGAFLPAIFFSFGLFSFAMILFSERLKVF